jgi:hypothetical protein
LSATVDSAVHDAFDNLDEGERALLQLSVARGIPDDELARATGADADDVRLRRRRAIAEMAARAGVAIPAAEAAIRELGDPSDDTRAQRDAAAALHGGESLGEREQDARAGFFRSNSLSLFFLTIFLAALIAQSYAGWRAYDDNQHIHRETGISYTRYLTSSSFANAVTENWQSEYLQFVLYFMATIWFVQRGSPESKKWRDRGRQTEKQQQLGRYARPDSPAWARGAGLVRALYSNSLLVVMGLFWVGSWFAQSVSGWSAYNSEQLAHGVHGTSWIGYVGSADFWQATLQNWQSEFLAVGSMAIFAVYLRQRGSPESKPVGAPHDETASTG